METTSRINELPITVGSERVAFETGFVEQGGSARRDTDSGSIASVGEQKWAAFDQLRRHCACGNHCVRVSRCAAHRHVWIPIVTVSCCGACGCTCDRVPFSWRGAARASHTCRRRQSARLTIIRSRFWVLLCCSQCVSRAKTPATLRVYKKL